MADLNANQAQRRGPDQRESVDTGDRGRTEETAAEAPVGHPIDVDAIREKYRHERDKRLRNSSGTPQYNFAEGKYAYLDDDPFAGPPAGRDAQQEDVDVLVIGGGFGGLLAGAGIRSAGVERIRILDVAADFGGTWYWNRYPGLRCDVESYTYMPLLEETGYIPTERYAGGAEILEYCRQIGRHFDLYKDALFQTRVTNMSWDEESARWIITTSRGDRLAARFVTTQSGIFSRPQLPGIPGIESFKGKVFHTARWDYEYTGGDSNGALNRIHDKRVALIGTGVTALGCVPHLATDAQHLTVFQRTPTAVHRRDNGPTDVDWMKSLPAGWQKERMENFTRLTSGEQVEESYVEDGWTRSARYQQRAVSQLPADERTDEAVADVLEKADFEWGEMLRDRVDFIVQDPQKAESLKPYYKIGCKRPGFSDHYLPAFNQQNVTLVDTSESSIERITETGIIVDGVEYEVDCLIFATGFETNTSWTHQAGYEIHGRDGLRLSEKWQGGAQTFHGLFSNGFPNIFFMGLTQTGVSVNVPHMLQEQVRHLVHIIDQCAKKGITTVEATPEAEREWCEVIRGKQAQRLAAQMECTPGYFNNEGRPEDATGGLASGMYFPGMEFFDLLRRWREAGDFRGLRTS